MRDPAADRTVYITLVGLEDQRSRARLLIDSIRSFGGEMRHCPIWLFLPDPKEEHWGDLRGRGVHPLPLRVPVGIKDYWFAAKVAACAQAEELATPEVQSLVWLSSDSLVLQPPLLFDLDAPYKAAVRPVHIKNVGLSIEAPLDPFWKGIYEHLGVSDVGTQVESFVDRQTIRAYINSHALAVNPAAGLNRRWLESFEELVEDRRFQAAACQDTKHQVFLHQAILSTILFTALDPTEIRLLPPTYSYPYNLHQAVPPDRRARSLNELVCIACEDRPLHPELVDDIEIHEPLRSWLATRAASPPRQTGPER